MPQRRVYFEYSPLSYTYPDDDSRKELFLQASGTIKGPLRKILLYWVNKAFNDGEEVWQVVRLDNRDNGYKYVCPDMIVIDRSERERNESFSLGLFDGAQRETVLECAEEIHYDERTTEEGQCLRWTNELLKQMVNKGLLTSTTVDFIRESVPLPGPNS